MPRAPINSKFKIQNSSLHALIPLLLDWFAVNARDLPWRRTRDPYAIWVSEIMLQQTQVKTVIPFWERWMRELPTIESLANAPAGKIHKLWEGLGYYTRVRNMQAAAQEILLTHGGKFPDKFDDVLALPGIGRYTAGAICSIAFNQPAPILDGNVIRVLTRVCGIAENPREKKTNARLWQMATQLVSHAKTQRRKDKNSKSSANVASLPEENSCSFLNQSLMELGALVCTPRQPECGICPVTRFCVARRENRVAELPNLGKRITATERRFRAFIVRRGKRYLVRQRPSGVVNAHLWEFPNVEISSRDTQTRAARRLLCTIKHSITRYRITLEAFSADERDVRDIANGDARWLTLAQLKELPFPSAHKKILAALDRTSQIRTRITTTRAKPGR